MFGGAVTRPCLFKWFYCTLHLEVLGNNACKIRSFTAQFSHFWSYMFLLFAIFKISKASKQTAWLKWRRFHVQSYLCHCKNTQLAALLPYSDVDFIYKENIGSKYPLETQRLKWLSACVCVCVPQRRLWSTSLSKTCNILVNCWDSVRTRRPRSGQRFKNTSDRISY